MFQSLCRDLLFPSKVSRKTEDRYEQKNEVEHSIGPEPRDDTAVFGRETDSRCNNGVQWQEEHGEKEGTRDGYSCCENKQNITLKRDIPATVYLVHRLGGKGCELFQR